MPSTYAHYHFGNLAMQGLDDNLKKTILKYRDLYNIGVHGPDILFYTEPYHSVPISDYGFAMHPKPASEFFTRAKEVYQNHPANQEAMQSYLLGFVTHFCLDTTDHPYVEAKIHASHVSHTLIEVEYDRHLLIKDGYNPLSKDLVAHIKPTTFNVDIVHAFFSQFTHEQIESTLKQMIFYIHLLSCKGFKRKALFTAMKAIGVYTMLHDQFMNEKAVPACEDSNLRLDKLEKVAYQLFLELAPNLINYLNDIEPLDERFNQTFDQGPNWESIKVLPLEEEKTYEI